MNVIDPIDPCWLSINHFDRFKSLKKCITIRSFAGKVSSLNSCYHVLRIVCLLLLSLQNYKFSL